MKQCNTNVIRRQAETIAALAATEYKFITTKQSIVAAAALAAAVQHFTQDSKEVLNCMKLVSAMISCDISEIFLLLSCLEKCSNDVVGEDLIHKPNINYDSHHRFICVAVKT